MPVRALRRPVERARDARERRLDGAISVMERHRGLRKRRRRGGIEVDPS